MTTLAVFFNERLQEVDSHLEFLDAMERSARGGAPQFLRVENAITTDQQKILYSTVYLQLYNLVEATMSRCVEAVGDAASSGAWVASDLIPELQLEWVRAVARTHVDLTPQNRLVYAMELVKCVVDTLPLPPFKIEKGGGGNWDDKAIEAISKRLGFRLRISASVMTKVKQKIRNDLGPIGLVKSLRNELAHGAISFVECAGETDVAALRAIRDVTADYMRGVMQAFLSYIDEARFVQEARRPAVEIGNG